MLVNLNQKTLLEFSLNPKYIKTYTDGLFVLRKAQISLVKEYGIQKYESFKKFINAVAPLEDEIEIYRFWHGYFFSEYFVLFISDLLKKIKDIDLTPFQDKIECKCKACGSVVLTEKIVRNGNRNKNR